MGPEDGDTEVPGENKSSWSGHDTEAWSGHDAEASSALGVRWDRGCLLKCAKATSTLDECYR